MSTQGSTFRTALLCGISLMAALARRRARGRVSFADQVVIITGGSRGLGFALAQRFAAEGARVILLARSADQLQAAVRKLRETGAHATGMVCDVRDRRAVGEAIDAVIDAHGRVDVLVNNAGVIQVTPFVHARHSDYEDSLRTHFWGPLYLIEACLPYFARQRQGRIINISSVGGRIALPHMIPYSVGKFALSALSDALRAELSPLDVTVTTVTPFLMRTGSHRNVLARGQHEKEARLFALGSSTPLTAMNVRRAARQIIEGSRAGRARIAPGWPTRAAEVGQALAPEVTAAVATAITRVLLPSPSDKPGATIARDSRDLKLGWVTRLFATNEALHMNQHIAPDEARR